MGRKREVFDRDEKTPFQLALEADYKKWQATRTRGDDTLYAYATERLGVTRPTLVNWLNLGKEPRPEALYKLYRKLGTRDGFAFYVSLGRVPPEKDLTFVIEQWINLSTETRREVIRLIKERQR